MMTSRPTSTRTQKATNNSASFTVYDDGVEFKKRVGQYEEELIREALEQTGGNQTHAAKLLRMPIRTLVYKIKNYGIKGE